jgi:hypothetical protein
VAGLASYTASVQWAQATLLASIGLRCGMADELIRPLLEQVEVAVEVAVDAPSLLGRETPDGEAQREAMASFLAEGLTARVDLTQARLLEPLKLHSSLDADATKPHVKVTPPLRRTSVQAGVDSVKHVEGFKLNYPSTACLMASADAAISWVHVDAY